MAGSKIVARVQRNNTIIRTPASICAGAEVFRVELLFSVADDISIEFGSRRMTPMTQPAKPETAPAPLPPDPYPDYPVPYTWFFQSWLVMFLTVICLALVMYLMTYLPKL